MFRRRSLVLTLFVIVLAATARAGEPFETIELGARYVANVNENRFHDYWDQGRGVELYAATPLAGGHVLTGLRYLTNDAAVAGVPDFGSLFAWAGVSFDADVSKRLRLSVGSAVGATQWFFDDDDTVGGLRNELEMGMEMFARVRVVAAGPWAVTSSVTQQETYTRECIRLTFFSIGLTHTFDTPDWLRRILE